MHICYLDASLSTRYAFFKKDIKIVCKFHSGGGIMCLEVKMGRLFLVESHINTALERRVSYGQDKI